MKKLVNDLKAIRRALEAVEGNNTNMTDKDVIKAILTANENIICHLLQRDIEFYYDAFLDGRGMEAQE